MGFPLELEILNLIQMKKYTTYVRNIRLSIHTFLEVILVMDILLKMPRTYKLRIFNDAKYDNIIEDQSQALSFSSQKMQYANINNCIPIVSK